MDSLVNSNPACLSTLQNPNGIPSLSPGLVRAGLARSYPGTTAFGATSPSKIISNPNGIASPFHRACKNESLLMDISLPV
jgi:hypothetical protein